MADGLGWSPAFLKCQPVLQIENGCVRPWLTTAGLCLPASPWRAYVLWDFDFVCLQEDAEQGWDVAMPDRSGCTAHLADCNKHDQALQHLSLLWRFLWDKQNRNLIRLSYASVCLCVPLSASVMAVLCLSLWINLLLLLWLFVCIYCTVARRQLQCFSSPAPCNCFVSTQNALHSLYCCKGKGYFCHSWSWPTRTYLLIWIHISYDLWSLPYFNSFLFVPFPSRRFLNVFWLRIPLSMSFPVFNLKRSWGRMDEL